MMLRSVVVLPAPLRPIRHTSLPSPTSSDTARRMRLLWMSTTTLDNVSMSVTLGRHLADDSIDERRVAEKSRGGPIGQHLAGLQSDDAARIFGNEVHVVLDENDRLHASAPRRVDERSHDAVLVGARHAARGLVEQDYFGRERKRTRDVEELLLALREQARLRVQLAFEPKDCRDLADALHHRVVTADRSEKTERLSST